MSEFLNTIKQVSGLAIFSFLFACSPIFAGLLGPLILSERLHEILFCSGNSGISQTAVVLGILALIYIKKKKLKGKLLAILGIILGGLGSFLFICL